jgi:RHS repeat-associated protein
LTDFVGAIVELYAFDAYGNAIGFTPSVALTEFLYSGEQFDSKIGQQYLRQRYYDPVTGRFNRLDPFFGNLNDPQSIHKYAYTHNDPVNNIDPSGKFVAIAIGVLSGIALSSYLNTQKSAKDLSTGALILRGLATVGFGVSAYFGTYMLYGIYGYGLGFKPLWAHGTHPKATENLSIQKWENNIADLLKDYVDKSTLTIEQKQKAKNEAMIIAKNYVSKMRSRANMLNILTESDNNMYGISNRGTMAAWGGNWGNPAAFCAEWVTEAKNAVSDSDSGNDLEFWTAIAHFDYSPMGDPSLGILFRHSFVSISLKDQNEPAFILDAWSTAYPEVYLPKSYFQYYGVRGIGYDR